LCAVVEQSGNESGSDKEAMQVRRPMLHVFKPKALATLTDKGRTLVTLEAPAKEATGTMLEAKAVTAMAVTAMAMATRGSA
jgi:hypothetical protein